MTRRVSIPFVLALLGLLGDAAGTPYLGASPAWATVCFVYDGDAFHTYRETAVGSSPIAPGSAPESLFADSGLGVCSDLADNAGDGLADAADAGCANSDGDSISGMPIDDAMETILGSRPASAASTPEHWLYDAIVFTVPVRCVDGLDNDGDDVIGGNAGADRISAGPGNDVVEGGPGKDQIRGGAGDDTLFGADGADTLRGDLGTDSCDGGNGLDVAASTCETVLNVP